MTDERQNKRNAFMLTVSSSVDFLQITGSDYILPRLLCATPFAQHGVPRQPTAVNCQDTAESLSGKLSDVSLARK